jgi:hypothetical protein
MNNNIIDNNMNNINNNMINNNFSNNFNTTLNNNPFKINWFDNNMFQNMFKAYLMKTIQNQIMQYQMKQYFYLMYQNYMMYQIFNMIKMKRRQQKMMEILDGMDKRNENEENTNFNLNNNDFNEEEIGSSDYIIQNPALLDVINEPPAQHQKYLDQNYYSPLDNDINTDIIINVMNLNPNLLSGYGNNILGKWAHGERRGGKAYNPPVGWVGYGLNVLSKYDNGNNDWLACNGRDGEWCIAYHGACAGQSSDNVKRNVKNILETNLRPGGGQAYRNKNDDNHPGHKIGIGVYCSPNPNVIEEYAGIMEISVNFYKVAFMLRVKPSKIRFNRQKPDYWVLNGDFAELRPYRLLIKQVNNQYIFR